MKTKCLYTIVLFLLGLSVSVHAQSEAGGFGGLQSSLNEFVDAVGDPFESLNQNYDEYIRLGWLVSSDIRMRMNAEFEAEHIVSGNYGYGALFSSYVSEREGSLYAEFDWQNMAESIRAKTSESEKWINIGPYNMEGTNQAEDFTMYVDAQGYWYVPAEQYGYIRVHLKTQMENVANTLALSIDAAIAAGATEVMDQLLAAMLTMDLGVLGVGLFLPGLPPEILAALMDPNVDVAGELLSSMTPLLQAQLASQLENIGNLPPFIHFAFIISPAAARTQFNVQEQTITWRGQDNCTKMTVLSGNDAGYQAVFDRYGRLIHLRDTDGSTADYWYDRDVTVNIPPAVSMGF